MSEDPAPTPWARWAPLAFVAIVCLVHQALAAEPALWAGPSDASKYLALARNAPWHRLYDEHVYVIHPPLYPLLIRAVSLVTWTSLPTAGTLLSSLATVGLALGLFAVGRRITGSVAGGLATAVVFSVSRGALYCGQGLYREPVQVLLLLALFAVALPVDAERAREPRRVALSAALGATLGVLWDPLVLLVPGLVAAAWFTGRRRALLAAALALAVAWGGWAVVRHASLLTVPEYAAGIDGTVEETRHVGPRTFFNPNFFPRTAQHNAYFWPTQPTPARALAFAAPWCVQAEGPFLETAPTPLQGAATGVLGVVALLGLGLLVRRRPAGWRSLLTVACALAFLGAPGAAGRTSRYAYALLPIIAVLVGEVVAFAARRSGRERLAVGIVAGLALLSTLGWLATHRVASWPRPQKYEGRSLARWLETSRVEAPAIAAAVGLTPDLCWELPGRRVVTLPFRAEGLFPLLERRDARLVLVPHEVRPFARMGVSRDIREEAASLPMLRAVHAAAADGRLRHLGVLLEGEVTDRARLRAFDLFWRVAPGQPGPAPFGAFVEPGSLEALARVLEEGALTAESRRLLAALGPVFAARVDDPAEGEAARRLLRLLGPG